MVDSEHTARCHQLRQLCNSSARPEAQLRNDFARSDGQRVWIYDRQLNQVTVRKLTAALGSTPAALLAGSSDIQSAFALSDAGEKDGLEWMDARPRERDAGFERVRMGFGKDGLQAMELTDNFGQTTYLRFSKLERNPKVDPKEFRFDPPKGADVLGDK